MLPVGLPADIWQHIGVHLALTDYLKLRRTCKALRKLPLPAIVTFTPSYNQTAILAAIMQPLLRTEALHLDLSWINFKKLHARDLQQMQDMIASQLPSPIKQLRVETNCFHSTLSNQFG
jgi:hypothetical protein